MSAVPEGWASATLSEVTEVIMGQSPPSSAYNDEERGLPFLQGKAEFGALRPTPVKWCTDVKKVAEAEDILVSVRAPVGPTNLSPTRCCIGRGLAALRPLSSFLANRFLLYQIRAREHELERLGHGVTFKAIRKKELTSWPTLVAPLPEQHRIVARIESLFASLDEGVAALMRVEANLERYRASVLKAAVEGRLTEQWRRENPPEETGEELLRRILAERRNRWEEEQLAKFAAKGRQPPKYWKARYKEPVTPDTSGLPRLPEGWCWATVDQVVWAMMNGYGKRSDTPGGTPRMVLRLADIRHDQISYQSPRFLDCTSQQIAKYRLAERDVLIIRVNGSADLVGRMVDCRNTNGDVLFCDHFIRAKCTTLVSAAWLRLCSKTERFRSHVERIRVSTAGQHTVSQGVILPFALPLPPEKEVLAILALADYLHSQSKPVESALADGRVNASAFRQSILKRAFEGGLVPQDPADEPASALLERIRADREAERKRRKRRRTKPRRQRRRRVP